MDNKKDSTCKVGTELIGDIVCNSIRLALEDGKRTDALIVGITITTRFSNGGSSKVDISVG